MGGGLVGTVTLDKSERQVLLIIERGYERNGVTERRRIDHRLKRSLGERSKLNTDLFWGHR